MSLSTRVASSLSALNPATRRATSLSIWSSFCTQPTQFHEDLATSSLVGANDPYILVVGNAVQRGNRTGFLGRSVLMQATSTLRSPSWRRAASMAKGGAAHRLALLPDGGRLALPPSRDRPCRGLAPPALHIVTWVHGSFQ